MENKGRIDFDLGEAGVANLPSTALSTYREFEQDAATWALFGQGTYHISDAWHLTVGLRWNNGDKDATQDYAYDENRSVSSSTTSRTPAARRRIPCRVSRARRTCQARRPSSLRNGRVT